MVKHGNKFLNCNEILVHQPCTKESEDKVYCYAYDKALILFYYDFKKAGD